MNCLILESNPVTLNKLAEFVMQVPFFDLKAKCSSVFKAYEVLQSQKIDLIFVDTHLPGISGADFIKSLSNNRPLFIFTSETAENAIDGFNLNALDFILKPILYDRFLMASNKAYEYFLLKNLQFRNIHPDKETISPNSEFVLVKADHKSIKINLDEILYVEGLKDYIKIYITSSKKPIITLNSLKNIQQNLPSERFSRIHKSYIISLNHIKIINKARVIIGDSYIPIGESYKNSFFTEMEQRSL